MFVVTYPRSGHHLLMNLLCYYFTDHKCENFETGQFSYCEYYHHCQKIPCSHAATLQKNHDFNLSLPKTGKVIVQFRNPFNSIISYAKFEKQNPTAWKQFATQKAQYWANFMKKWASHPTALIVPYEQLVAFPEKTLASVLDYYHGSHDPARIKQVLAAIPIENRNKNLERSPYFNEQIYLKIISLCRGVHILYPI